METKSNTSPRRIRSIGPKLSDARTYATTGNQSDLKVDELMSIDGINGAYVNDERSIRVIKWTAFDWTDFEEEIVAQLAEHLDWPVASVTHEHADHINM